MHVHLQDGTGGLGIKDNTYTDERGTQKARNVHRLAPHELSAAQSRGTTCADPGSSSGGWVPG
eukprot:7525371-Alexandrium_andersonii.AAC.1